MLLSGRSHEFFCTYMGMSAHDIMEACRWLWVSASSGTLPCFVETGSLLLNWELPDSIKLSWLISPRDFLVSAFQALKLQACGTLPGFLWSIGDLPAGSHALTPGSTDWTSWSCTFSWLIINTRRVKVEFKVVMAELFVSHALKSISTVSHAFLQSFLRFTHFP